MKLLKPKFIILDELDSGLDVDSVKIVAKNVLQYKKEYPDTSILIITHLPNLFIFKDSLSDNLDKLSELGYTKKDTILQYFHNSNLQKL